MAALPQPSRGRLAAQPTGHREDKGSGGDGKANLGTKTGGLGACPPPQNNNICGAPLSLCTNQHPLHAQCASWALSITSPSRPAWLNALGRGDKEVAADRHTSSSLAAGARSCHRTGQHHRRAGIRGVRSTKAGHALPSPRSVWSLSRVGHTADPNSHG
ncbi:uncharacterized protein CC84DRAFT_1208930 [Paraphaeosphaeria sporulosa]|uniref:Uncharacterized protein n=1 Tax=Paraphaeosphaeria sporulosa TaxID=1460663 RepID=A0A177C051_9PLEO|nr:uncharacterized protein CC84DRAFT_1208930 [Paraphaeosphaeria sporulosa]OAG00786.1 hypothetical protein CC84DRAFT_1208930 [Paraphaeosphaeria sporulosa]